MSKLERCKCDKCKTLSTAIVTGHPTMPINYILCAPCFVEMKNLEKYQAVKENTQEVVDKLVKFIESKVENPSEEDKKMTLELKNFLYSLLEQND